MITNVTMLKPFRCNVRNRFSTATYVTECFIPCLFLALIGDSKKKRAAGLGVVVTLGMSLISITCCLSTTTVLRSGTQATESHRAGGIRLLSRGRRSDRYLNDFHRRSPKAITIRFSKLGEGTQSVRGNSSSF